MRTLVGHGQLCRKSSGPQHSVETPFAASKTHQAHRIELVSVRSPRLGTVVGQKEQALATRLQVLDGFFDTGKEHAALEDDAVDVENERFVAGPRTRRNVWQRSSRSCVLLDREGSCFARRMASPHSRGGAG
jgi:hypothetical protein